jgi:hypothetical protein
VAGKDCFVFLKHEDEGAPWIWADRLVEFTKTLSHGANGT